jgi:hypothetical protein
MNTPTPVPSKEKLPDWLRRWYALKGEPRFREAADEIERLQRELDRMTSLAGNVLPQLHDAVARAENEPGLHRCDDEHAPVYYDGNECPVCDALVRWMSEANAPRTTQPPGSDADELRTLLLIARRYVEHCKGIPWNAAGGGFDNAENMLYRIDRATATK